jgi:hypothetical protein
MIVRLFRPGDHIEWTSATVLTIAALADSHAVAADAGYGDLRQLLSDLMGAGDPKWRCPPRFILELVMQRRRPPIERAATDTSGWDRCKVCRQPLDPAAVAGITGLNGQTHPSCEMPWGTCKCSTPWDGLPLRRITGTHCVTCHDNFSHDAWQAHMKGDGCVKLSRLRNVDGAITWELSVEDGHPVWRRARHNATLPVTLRLATKEAIR